MAAYNERWIASFMTCSKRDEIMEKAGIGKQRYYNLKNDPEFMRIVNERRGDIVRSAVMKMESYLSEAVEILQDIIRNEETAPQVKINAIQLLLSQYNNFKTLTDIQERIEHLEKIAGTQE